MISADVTAGEDGLDNIRLLDQLIAVVKVIFQDRFAMIKFMFGEFRRWQGRQLLNQVFLISRIDQNKLNYNILMFDPQIISKENKENQNFKMLTN